MQCTKGKFSLFEQVWMQLSFHSIWILGALAIFWLNPIIAILYIILFPFIGILYGIMHTWICPRCPHIKEHCSCIQLPPYFTKKLIKKGVTKPMSRLDTIGFFIVLYGIFLVPVYWVIETKILLIPYTFFVLMHYLAYYIRFCKKCLNTFCPQNMNRGIHT